MEKSNLNGENNIEIINQKMSFNIDEIITKCKEKDGNELINFICAVMKEKKRNILEALYKELGKDYLIFTLEKALNIENNGGLNKEKSKYQKKEEDKTDQKDNNKEDNISINEKKSTGGIFFTLIKKDPEGKKILNKASRKDWKEARQRKKVYKLMDNLNI